MQNSNPSQNPSSVPTPQSIDSESLARAYERARARMLAGERASGDIVAVFTTRSEDHAGEANDPRSSAAPHPRTEPRDSGERPDAGDRSDVGERVTLDELLAVFREPIAWALARAERRAQGDPIGLAALSRVRGAYQRRLAWIGTGGAFGEARPPVRPTDVLTAVGLLVGSIDPGLAQRASTGMREGLLDALAAAIPLAASHAPPAAGAPPPSGPFCHCNDRPDELVPFGPPRIPRPAVPTCCCPHGHVL